VTSYYVQRPNRTSVIVKRLTIWNNLLSFETRGKQNQKYFRKRRYSKSLEHTPASIYCSKNQLVAVTNRQPLAR